MYKLTISGHSKSKAKLLCRRTKHFIVGQEYEIYFIIKNIGDEPSPPVTFSYTIHWPGTEAKTTEDIIAKSFGPGRFERSDPRTYTALSTGLGGVVATAHTNTPDKKEIKIWKKDGIFIRNTTDMFELIYATTPEAIYEYWGVWIAAIGLIIIAFEKILSPLQYFLSLLGI